jgi:CRP-like cAMP-binding protein
MEFMRPLFIACQDRAGSTLFKQGGMADYLFVVIDGEIDLRYKPDDGPELTVTKVRSGGVLGWSAVLGNQLYSSSAICLTDCTMLRVCSDALHDLCVEHPETGRIIIDRLAAVIAERIRGTHHHVISLLNQGLRIQMNEPAASG